MRAYNKRYNYDSNYEVDDKILKEMYKNVEPQVPIEKIKYYKTILNYYIDVYQT